MDAPRQIRINVNGKLQFTAKVPQSEDLHDVAKRAAETMRLTHMRAIVSPGQINFVPKHVRP